MVSWGGNKKYFMKEMLFYKRSMERQKLPHLLIKIIIVCIHLDRYIHTYLNVFQQSHLGNAWIQTFPINYRSIWSLWVVSRVVSFIVTNSGARIQMQLVSCGLHSSLQSLTVLCQRAILYLQGYFGSITLQSWGAVFLYFVFQAMCIGFIMLSHLFNTKTDYNTQGHIVYGLPYFMTEFAFNQLKLRVWKSLF